VVDPDVVQDTFYDIVAQHIHIYVKANRGGRVAGAPGYPAAARGRTKYEQEEGGVGVRVDPGERITSPPINFSFFPNYCNLK
jgi:hypothetical protein